MRVRNPLTMNNLEVVAKKVGIPAAMSFGGGFVHGIVRGEGSDLDVLLPPLVSLGVSFIELKTNAEGISKKISTWLTESYSKYASKSHEQESFSRDYDENISGAGPGPVVLTHVGIYTLGYSSGRLARNLAESLYDKAVQ